jgi:predicted CXXCH cytochrome family protein
MGAAGDAETETVECTTCHDPHSRTTKEWTLDEQRQLCSGCHDPASYMAREHDALACTECHRLHGGNADALLSEYSADLLCRSCHDPNAAFGSQTSVAGFSATGKAGHKKLPEGSCLDCHSSHR